MLIVEAAARIAAGSIDNVVLRPLAAACGCTTSTIYSLFGSRDGLIQAVREYVEASFSKNQHDVPTTGDPTADLMNLGRAYRSWATANPTLYQVMFGRLAEPGCAPPGLPAHGSIGPLVDAVGRAVSGGKLGGGRIEQITRSIWAGVHGWAMLELGGMTPQGPRKSVSEYELHLRSLLAAWRPD
jgi:AcrR family transcriptional regulator